MFNQLAHSHFSPWFWGPGFGNRSAPTTGHSRPGTAPTVEPSYYYSSSQEMGVLEVELPGVSKENLSIEVNGHHLNISGKRFRKNGLKQTATTVEEVKEGEPETTENGTKSDEPASSFTYVLELRLGHDADVEAVKVESYTDGVLVLNIPNMARNQPRKITIGV